MNKYKDDNNIYLNRYLVIKKRDKDIFVINTILNDGIIFTLERNELDKIFSMVKEGIEKEKLVDELKKTLKDEESVEEWLDFCIKRGIFE